MRGKKKATTGIHYLADVYGTEPEVLGSLKVPDTKRMISTLVKRSGFTELGRFYFAFRGGGMTGLISLRESHIAFHTWPELGYTTLDVYTCNFARNNTKKTKWLFQRLVALFSSGETHVKIHRLHR